MIDVTFGSIANRPEFAALREYMEAKYGKPEAGDDNE
jgi:hypothetical protein